MSLKIKVFASKTNRFLKCRRRTNIKFYPLINLEDELMGSHNA